MKVTFFENNYGTSFELTPETVEEVSALARIAKNSKAEKPVISFYFSGAPSCSIWIKKIKPSAQINSISNNKK